MAIFEEIQRVPKAWFLAPLAPAALVGVAALAGEPMRGTDLLIGAAVLGLIACWMSSLALITKVSEQEVTIHYRGLFKTRRVPIDAIRSAGARTYRPILEYGGWGIRLGRSGWAYNASGNRGVQLEIDGARPLLIGSGRPEELARAITSSGNYRNRQPAA
jgi:hypothetical protein